MARVAVVQVTPDLADLTDFTPRTCSTLPGGECPLINHFNIWGSDSTLLTNQAPMFCTHQHIWECRNAQ